VLAVVTNSIHRRSAAAQHSKENQGKTETPWQVWELWIPPLTLFPSKET
jgi:hypothetical protein